MSITTKSYCHIYGQLGQTADRFSAELDHLLGLGLVCDSDFGFEQAAQHHGSLRKLQKCGGLVAPNIYPVDLDPACPDPNWWKYSEAECVRLLRIAQERFSGLGLGPMVAVNTYTPCNGFVAACRQLGIRYILGFCAPTVIEDGGWSISHYGSPLSPYFISEEDFRKPENPSQRTDPVVMASMELRNPLVCLNHWSEGPWCPLNALAADRWLEPGDDPLPFVQMAEDWLRQAEMTGTPRFFHINLQYFFAVKCYDHNRRALEWLADQRDKGRLDIGSLTTWAERMQSAGGFVRQPTYWRGEMMGSHVGHRPGSFPDVIVDESLARQAVWKYPHATPQRCYDYGKTWSYPAFEPTGTAPASEPFAGIEVKTKVLSTEGLTRRVEVSVTNAGAKRILPLALWDLLEKCAGPFSVESPDGWQASVLPHPAGTTGAVLLEGMVPAGEIKLELTVGFGAAMPITHRKSWGSLLEAQTFEHRGQPCTYLVTQTPERFVVSVRSKCERVRVESLCGMDYEERELPANGLALQFDGTRLACWHRFRGLRSDELEIEGVGEVEAKLRRQTAELVAHVAPQVKLPEPGYQLFGNIRDTSRWDREVGRAGGDAEMKRMNEWFRQQRPGSGEVVIEVHPGIYLPRGSITKVLGHEFDVERCADGYGFKELCVDYPQGWDWGVAAWVQWRHLKVQIEGLQGRTENHVLHIHAFDPEVRDISQRIHFFNPEATAIAPLLDTQTGVRSGWEMCVASHWELPKGLDGRWQSEALCSVRIPDECLAWKSIGVWISPLEKMKLHDWVAEKGAPGLFSHLWVTKQ
ncbi:MAG: hypothetical protein NTV93_00920 [Verrucomicrobia bacterium]|nr:hypothetical protein [Verrucomicrobiota bacterium]